MTEYELSPHTVRHRSHLEQKRARGARVGRVTFAAIAVGVLSLGGLAYVADGTSAATPIEYRVAPQPGPAALALGYQPGDAPSERRIAAAQRFARDQPSADRYVDLALALMQRRRETSDAAYLQYAVDAIEAAEPLAGDDHFRVLTVRALIAQDGHRFEDALFMARKLAHLEPSDPVGHLLAGDALLELGRYREAIDAYQKAVDVRPDLRSYNRIGHLRWLHGDFSGAVEMIELALDAGSPRDPEPMAWCYVDLGNMYLEQGDAARALASAKLADKLLADYAPAMVLRARALAMQGQREDAIAQLEAVVKRLPHVADLLVLSEWLDAEGRHDEAQRRLAQAEQLASADPRPLAHHYARHDIEPTRALALAEQELQARRNIAALDTHALALIRAGRLDAAERALERAMQLGTQSAEMLLHQSLLSLERGDRAMARTTLEAALALNAHADPLLVAELRRELEDR